jgi:ABC-type transport system involved in multi-copper enzyme maturation permease subunit
MNEKPAIAELWSQMIAVIRIELTKTFFARRSLWIYLLALLPVALFYINSIYAKREHERLARIAVEHAVSRAALRNIRPNSTVDQVVQTLGQPYRQNSREFWMGRPPQHHERLMFYYTDGEVDFTFFFNDGILRGTGRSGANQSLPQLLLVFASVYQLYFVRLAIFFGCAGIFTNLFRGEMLDKSLHFYLLAPIPRPILVAGKYVAGLFATAIIFSASTALQFYAMLRGFDSVTVHDYLQRDGWHHIAAYMGISALACAAYGSIFLAAGLVAKNPAVIAALLLLWESVNAFIPGSLKMASVVFYVQSLCPIEAPPDVTIPPALLALVAPPERVSTFAGIAVMAALALVVLVCSGFFSRNLEINYSAD